MSQEYILTIKEIFDAAAQDQAFDAIKRDVAQMNDARHKSDQPFIGTMIIEVDNDRALASLKARHDARFYFQRSGIMKAS